MDNVSSIKYSFLGANTDLFQKGYFLKSFLALLEINDRLSKQGDTDS